MAERGRPTQYKPEYAETVFDYCLLGCNNEDLARIYEVDVRTIDRWLAEHEDFRRAVLEGVTKPMLASPSRSKKSDGLHRQRRRGNPA